MPPTDTSEKRLEALIVNSLVTEAVYVDRCGEGELSVGTAIG